MVQNYTTYSDSLLTELLRASDHAAFTEIHNRYYTIVFVEAYKKLRDEDEAKDIAQVLFINLWINRRNIPVVNHLAGYLFTSTKNAIINLLEHQTVKSKYITSLANYVNTGNIANTDYLVREKEWAIYIDNAIEALPERMRHVFQLNKKEHLSYQEIAKKLNTSENNIQKHVNAAIKILRAKLNSLFF